MTDVVTAGGPDRGGARAEGGAGGPGPAEGADGTGATIARAADVVAPGLGALLRGQRRGLPLLGGWTFLWTIAVLRWDRVLATWRGGDVDEWIALGALAVGLATCWAVANLGGSPDDGRAGALARAPGRAPPWRRFLRHRQAALGFVLLAALGASALLTPYLAPYEPHVQEDIVETRYQSPSAEHPMGTDRFGRDVFSRVLYGARISLGIGVIAVLIAITLGTLVGSAAGYVGGWLDTAAMRGVDMLLSFPRLVLLITVVALFEPSITLVTLVLGFTGWMGTSRIVRGEVLSIREKEYVQAARALGYGDGRIVFRHVLPNALSPVIVSATLGVGHAILAEAALSFLGLGVQPPTASWGNMVAAGRDVMLEAWWITLFPGLAIVLTVMSFNLVGDGLRDALDPRHTGAGGEP